MEEMGLQCELIGKWSPPLARIQAHSQPRRPPPALLCDARGHCWSTGATVGARKAAQPRGTVGWGDSFPLLPAGLTCWGGGFPQLGLQEAGDLCGRR